MVDAIENLLAKNCDFTFLCQLKIQDTTQSISEHLSREHVKIAKCSINIYGIVLARMGSSPTIYACNKNVTLQNV